MTTLGVINMPDETATAARERTKQARLWSKAVVTIAATAGAACGGFVTYATTPKSVSLEEVKAAITESLDPLKAEVASVRATADFARSDAEWVKKRLDTDIKDMAREIVQIGKVVAALDERTKKSSP